MSSWLKHLLLFWIVLFIAQNAVASSKVYTWHDENGVLVFSDSPRPGAKQIQVKDKSIKMPATNTSILTEELGKPAKANLFTIQITQPVDQATLRDNNGTVRIIGLVSPQLNNGYLMNLKFNGKSWGKPQRSGRFILRNINRGEHTVMLELLAANGKVVATSEAVTFYLHRHSIIKNN